MHSLSLKTRREFLRSTVLGSALSWTVPAFLANTFSALQAAAADSATQVPTGRDATILVVLQMAGGNDGLNTAVPFADDFYRQARPKIGVPADQVLKLSGAVGLHPGLTGFKALYDAGQLSVVQGVGYPNPNRSHFRSTEIWQTASDSERFERYGWIGRYFDHACAGCDPTVGVCLGRQMPQSFASRSGRGISLDNPQNYRFLPGRTKPGELAITEDTFKKLNEPADGSADNSGATIGALGGSVAPAGSALDYVERVALDAELSSEKIRAISGRVQNQVSYPASQLGASLKLVARLIGGGLATRIFYVSQGGYDTHTNQAGNHARLLRDLGDSVKAFVDDLNAQANFERVLLLTFSEFGRRVTENANQGTDHGAAAPMFVVGGRVKAGLLGRYPSLAPADRFQGDLKFTVDFRGVYAAILDDWLKTPSAPILGRKFDPLALV